MPDSHLVQFAKEVSKIIPEFMRELLKRQAKGLATSNISLPQVLILDVLKDKGPMRMAELAQHLSVSMSAVTALVDKLVKSSLVVRSGLTQDRRIVNIHITAKGKNLIDRYNKTRQNTIIEIFGSLSLSDRNSYLEILRKIRDNLKRDKE